MKNNELIIKIKKLFNDYEGMQENIKAPPPEVMQMTIARLCNLDVKEIKENWQIILELPKMEED